MDDEYRRALIDNMKTLREKFKDDPEAKRAFLVRAGILTKRGKLTKPYRSECTRVVRG